MPSFVRPVVANNGILEGDTLELEAVNLWMPFGDEPVVLPARDLTTDELVEVEAWTVSHGHIPFTFYGASGPEEAADSTVRFKMRLRSVEPGHRYRLWVNAGDGSDRVLFAQVVTVSGELDRSKLTWRQRFRLWWSPRG